MNVGLARAVLEQTVAAGDAVGVVALAVDDDGVSCHAAAGLRDREAGAAMSPDAIFNIASMTKAVTSVAALQCVERGQLALDMPVSEVLPALAEAPVLEGYAADGQARLRPAARPVTVMHLLTHTSGLAYTTWDASLYTYRQRFPEARPVAGPDLRLSAPLMRDPGERWCYSTSTDWLGLAVEAVSGLSLEAYFATHVFGPLHMRDTTFAPAEPAVGRVAGRYLRGPDGALHREPPTPDPARPLGGGGLYSTALDYARFMAALLDLRGPLKPEAQILRRDTVADMFRNQIGSLGAGRMPSSEPRRSADVDFFPDSESGWGLGFLVNAAPVPGGRAAGSLCWGGLYNTYYWLDPRARLAGAIFTQVLPFADPRILARYAAFERCVYG